MRSFLRCSAPVCIVTFLACLLAGSVTAYAQTLLTTDFTSFEFRTAAENGQSPATSGAFAGPLYVRERGNEANPELEVQAFLRFDLSGLSDAPIQSATLLLHENNKLNNVNSADMSIARVTGAWDTGATPPQFDITPVVDEFVFGNNGPASAGPTVDIDFAIDITDYVLEWQNDPLSNEGVRLAFAQNAFVGAAFDSTGADAPVLQVVQIVPEPGSLAVWTVVGLLGVVLFRRHRK